MPPRALALLAVLVVTAAAAVTAAEQSAAPAAADSPSTPPAAADSPATPSVDAAADSVVSVDATRTVGLETDGRGSLKSSGFVVATGAGKGIVVTDHADSAARASPATYTLRFKDGGNVPAKLLYYDPADDVAFLQFDLADRGAATTRALRLGTVANLSVGTPLALVATQGGVTIRRDGVLVEPRSATDPERKGGTPHTARRVLATFERVSGMSGSPVVTEDGSVVGMQSGTNGAYAAAVPIDKIKALLDALQAGRTPRRGDLGAVLRLLPAGAARRSYGVPADAVAKPADGGTPQVVSVLGLQPGVDAAGGLLPGDIITKVDGVAVGDDLMALDRAADAHTGGSVPVVVFRNGTKVDLAKVPVRDLEAMKVKKFALFGGGTFHDVSDETRTMLPAVGAASGVVMTKVEPGTPFARLGASKSSSSSRSFAGDDSFGTSNGMMLVTQVNGQKIGNLADFVKVANRIAPGSNGYAVARDLMTSSALPSGKVSELTFNTARYPLRVFDWDAAKLDWVDESGASAASADGAAPSAAPAKARAAPAAAPGAAPAAKARATAAAAPAAAPAAKARAAPATAPGARVSAPAPALVRRRALLQTASAKPEGGQASADKPAGGSRGSAADRPSADRASGASADRASSASRAPADTPVEEAAASGTWSAADKARLRRSVVAVHRVTDASVNGAARGDLASSGFVVSVGDDRVVIVTYPLSSNAPSTFEVTFDDGSTVAARPLDANPYVTYLSVNRTDAPANVTALPLGPRSSIKPGDRLLLLAASDDGTSVAREGTALVLGDVLRTNIPVARNSRSAPVFDAGGRVVAVHSFNSGEGTLSFEDFADYAAAGLDDVLAGRKPRWGITGVNIDAISTGVAVRHYGLPPAVATEVAAVDSGGPPQVLLVTAVDAWANATGTTVRPGDILFRHNGTMLRDDSTGYKLARAAYVNGSMPVQVYRRGQLVDAAISVLDWNAQARVKRYAKFAGTVFHDMTGPMRQQVGGVDAEPGVLMSSPERGSTFDGVLARNEAVRVLLSLNGANMTSLDAFVAAARNISDKDKGWIVSRRPDSGKMVQTNKVTFNTRIDPLQIFVWDDAAKEWKKEA